MESKLNVPLQSSIHPASSSSSSSSSTILSTSNDQNINKSDNNDDDIPVTLRDCIIPESIKERLKKGYFIPISYFKLIKTTQQQKQKNQADQQNFITDLSTLLEVFTRWSSAYCYYFSPNSSSDHQSFLLNCLSLLTSSKTNFTIQQLHCYIESIRWKRLIHEHSNQTINQLLTPQDQTLIQEIKTAEASPNHQKCSICALKKHIKSTDCPFYYQRHDTLSDRFLHPIASVDVSSPFSPSIGPSSSPNSVVNVTSPLSSPMSPNSINSPTQTTTSLLQPFHLQSDQPTVTNSTQSILPSSPSQPVNTISSPTSTIHGRNGGGFTIKLSPVDGTGEESVVWKGDTKLEESIAANVGTGKETISGKRNSAAPPPDAHIPELTTNVRSLRPVHDYCELQEHLNKQGLTRNEFDRIAIDRFYYEIDFGANPLQVVTESTDNQKYDRLRLAAMFMQDAKQNRIPRSSRFEYWPTAVYMSINHPLYRIFFKCIIWLHMLISCWEPPSNLDQRIWNDGGYRHSETATTITAIEATIVAIYFVDLFAHIYHLGVRTAIATRTFRFNILLCLLLLVDLLLDVFMPIPFVRVGRFLRAAKLVYESRSLSNTVYALFKTIPNIVDIIILMFCVILLFGIAGVHLFYDIYEDEKELKITNVFYNGTVLYNETVAGSVETHSFSPILHQNLSTLAAVSVPFMSSVFQSAVESVTSMSDISLSISSSSSTSRVLLSDDGSDSSTNDDTTTTTTNDISILDPAIITWDPSWNVTVNVTTTAVNVPLRQNFDVRRNRFNTNRPNLKHYTIDYVE